MIGKRKGASAQTRQKISRALKGKKKSLKKGLAGVKSLKKKMSRSVGKQQVKAGLGLMKTGVKIGTDRKPKSPIGRTIQGAASNIGVNTFKLGAKTAGKGAKRYLESV